jgi:DNA polymerase zeta
LLTLLNRLLFRTKDLSIIKEYCCRTWKNILDQKISLQDYIFAKEVRLGTYRQIVTFAIQALLSDYIVSEDILPPPGVAVVARRMLHDPSNQPNYGERVPYVIARLASGLKLTERAVDPQDFLDNRYVEFFNGLDSPHGCFSSASEIDAEYYISRVLIPPLARILNLVGADVQQWFADMAKTQALEPSSPNKVAFQEHPLTPGRSDLEEHFENPQCVICGNLGLDGENLPFTTPVYSHVQIGSVCYNCFIEPQETWAKSLALHQMSEKYVLHTQMVCASCCGTPRNGTIECKSLDCPWTYARRRADKDWEYTRAMKDLLEDPKEPREEEEHFEIKEEVETDDETTLLSEIL